MKQYTLINRVLAGVSFLITLITYALTLQPSVPFWDCGEFSAATAWQQVPHPPGAPLFLIVARWFHMLPFGDPGWRINMVSAVASAVTAALVYLITVKIVERWRPFKEGNPITSAIATFGAGLIGTLAFTWSDTQWFNSVESEVYAAGTLLIALMMWLMMRWDANAERPGHERYLLGMAYVTGLAFGVHLLALLVVPGIAMVIYFRRYKFNVGTFALMLLITAIGFFFLVYKVPLNIVPSRLASSWAWAIPILGILLFGIWWGVKKQNSVVYLSSTSMLLILLGFTTYTHILVRANAHPVMNENEPDTMKELVAYLGRDQYGNRGDWPRRQEVEKYYRDRMDRYGEWYPPVGRNPDGTYVYDKINTWGEVKFAFSYQIYQMYFRYLLWNFMGRASDVQDAPATFLSVSPTAQQQFIAPTGYPDVFPIRFFAIPFILGLIGCYYHFRRDWKMALVYTTLFLLLGVVAALQQNQQEPQPRERDYFYIGSFMIFAMWIGVGVLGIADTVAKRGQEGADDEGAGDTDVASQKTGLITAIMAVGLIAAPINMAVGGWHAHDRSKNWVPWDYAYNILQSCEKDAILFTNGDNDTFPLWYMQDVAGVRRDIRVVNLSLGQTSWYIWQLKNERPWGALPVPISISDEVLRLPEDDQRALHAEQVDKMPVVSLDVPGDVMAWATHDSLKQGGKMTWTMEGMDYGGQKLIGVQHRLVRDILENNKWKRPVYFSTSTQEDVWIGLHEYFRAEGMAYRIMPVKQPPSINSVASPNIDVMRKCLLGVLPDDQSFAEPHYGFKFRNLNNPNYFFMEDHRRLMLNYRLVYIAFATEELYNQKDSAGAIAVLDKLEQQIAPDMFGMPFQFAAEIANIYKDAGSRDKAAKYAQRTIADIDAVGEATLANLYGGNPYQVKAQMYAIMGEYDKAAQVYQGLSQQDPNNPNIRAQIENLQIEQYLSKKDTASAVTQIQKLIVAYGADTSGQSAGNINALKMRVAELTHTKVDATQVDTAKKAPAAPAAPAAH